MLVNNILNYYTPKEKPVWIIEEVPISCNFIYALFSQVILYQTKVFVVLPALNS
jgi:hypothetical protein